MKKNKTDVRSLLDVVAELVSERTSYGDQIDLTVTMRGQNRPNILLTFRTTSETMAQYNNTEEDLSDWVDDKPYYIPIDDVTGQEIAGEYRRGFDTWEEYIDKDLGPKIQGIIKAGGRLFSYKIAKGDLRV